MAKILILNGSPRKNGNTELLCDALGEGAATAGHRVERINIRDKNIGFCKGCYACYDKKAAPCIQKDDMTEVYDAVERADTIVIASPLYWWQFTAQMKTVIDRLFGLLASKDMSIGKKGCALVIAAEDAREVNFAQVTSYFDECFMQNLGWQDKGKLLAGGVVRVGDVAATDLLDRAKELGASL